MFTTSKECEFKVHATSKVWIWSTSITSKEIELNRPIKLKYEEPTCVNQGKEVHP